MATDSTTLRVSIQTRDRLTALARARGISVSALIAEMAARLDREAIFQAEREATRAEASSATRREEDDDWSATTEDGVE